MSNTHHLGFFTRAHVARILGVHITTIRRWEKRSRNPLPHVRDASGVHRFPREAILAMAEKAGRLGGVAGSIAGQVFERFAAGEDWRIVAVKMKLHPEQARKFFELYALDDPQHSEAARIALAKREPPDTTPSGAPPLESSSLRDWERANDEALRRIQVENDRLQREWEEARARRDDGGYVPSAYG